MAADPTPPTCRPDQAGIADSPLSGPARFQEENPNPVFRATVAGEVLFANAQARKILAWPSPPGGGTPAAPFLGPIRAASAAAATMEVEWICPNGREFSFSLVPVEGEDCVDLYGYDITRYKQTERRYRESQERLDLIDSATADGVIICEHGRIVDCNSQFARIIGRVLADVPGMTLEQVVAPENVQRAWDSVRFQRDSSDEFLLLHADGFRIPVEVIGRVIGKDTSGQQRLLLVRDLSMMRLRERKLDQLNRTLRAIQHSGQALLRAVDESAYLTQVCQNIVEDCGHNLAWVGSVGINECIRPVAWACGNDDRLMEGMFTAENCQLCCGPVGTAAQAGVMSYCRDTQIESCFAPWREQAVARGYRSILAFPLLAGGCAFATLAVYAGQPEAFSDREIALLSELADDLAFGIQTIRLRLAHAQAENALRISQSDLNRAQAMGHIGSWRLDSKIDKLSFSAENHRIFELSEDSRLTYESLLTAVHPDDRDLFDQKWQAAMEGEPFEFEHRLFVNGRVKWVRERAELEFDAVGAVMGGFGTTHDITKRKLMEKALQRSETRFRELVEQTSDGIFVHDASGRFLDVNQAGAEMYGYTRQEILRLGVTDLLMPEEHYRARVNMVDNQDEGRTVRSEWRARRKDGSSFVIEVAVRRLHDGRSQAVVRDITERRQNEADRLIALERQRDALVREVHHRIKNHLQGVIALMRNRIDAMPALARPLSEAISQVDTIAQVYGLQCRGEGSPVTVDGLVAIAVRSAGGTIAVDRPGGDETRITALDPVEIVPVALVINELITNAIKHCNAGVGAGSVRIALSSADDTASIRIRNEPARLPEGFDFAAGAGLGTGLELVRSLLPPQGASLTFRQQENGVVAEFALTLPVLLPRQDYAQEP